MAYREKLNRSERVNMVNAMEFIARQINHEGIFMHWLSIGVADGDIPYGSFEDTEDRDYYIEDDDTFADLMKTFLRCMKAAADNGGLYCNGVVSKDAPEGDDD